jgi:hypothetical protein
MNIRIFSIAIASALATIAGPADATVTYTVTSDIFPILAFHFTNDNFLTGSGTITGAQFDNCTDCSLTYSTSNTFPNDQFSVISGGGGSASIQFATGSFQADGTYSSLETEEGTLVVSGSPSAVPEPRTWAMMLLGFATIGVALRRRRNVRSALV